MTLEFIRALLTANKNEQREFLDHQTPLGVFKVHLGELRWIFHYNEQHDRFPTLKAFLRRFPDIVLPKTKETLPSLVQTVLDQNLFNQTSRIVEEARVQYEHGSDIRKVVLSLKASLDDIQLQEPAYTDASLGDTKSVFEIYRKRVRDISTPGKHTNPTPWKSYNDLAGFSEWGEHTIIASRTSTGKTWCLLYWACYLAKHGEKVLFISKEMPTHQILQRVTCLAYQLPFPRFRIGRLTPSELRRWHQLRSDPEEQKWKNNLVVTGHETEEGIGFHHIKSKIRQYSPTTMIVDGAYLIWPEGMRANTPLVERIIRVSNTLKRICISNRIKGISAIQAKREAEDREGNTAVVLKDLFGGDIWAQDADNVLLISGRRGAPTRQIAIAKAREFMTGTFAVKFRLDPFPDFSETLGIAQTGGAAQFSTV